MSLTVGKSIRFARTIDMILLLSFLALTMVGCTPRQVADDDSAPTPTLAPSPTPTGTPVAAIEECLLGFQNAFEPTQVVVLEAQQGPSRVALVRSIDPDAMGTSGTKIWIAEALAWEFPHDSGCIRSRPDLQYTITHHNFLDAIETVASSPKVLFQMQTAGYGEPWVLSVMQKDDDGTTNWGPIVVDAVSCTEIAGQTNCLPWPW